MHSQKSATIVFCNVVQQESAARETPRKCLGKGLPQEFCKKGQQEPAAVTLFRTSILTRAGCDSMRVIIGSAIQCCLIWPNAPKQ